MPKQRKHLVDYGSALAWSGKTTTRVKRSPTPRWGSSDSPVTRLCQAGTTRWLHQKCKVIFARPLRRARYIFEDPPSCPDLGDPARPHPCKGCPFMKFVP